MVRHIVMWSLEGNLTKQEKKETAGKIKELLEPIKAVSYTHLTLPTT